MAFTIHKKKRNLPIILELRPKQHVVRAIKSRTKIMTIFIYFIYIQNHEN